jgi:hypothetical protein
MLPLPPIKNRTWQFQVIQFQAVWKRPVSGTGRHGKTSLDAAAINVMRPKKNKKGKKAIQPTQASPQPPQQETHV